jgi:uncharacterized protein with PQ loop repeat
MVVHDTHGLHHHHKKKRVRRKEKKLPKNKWKATLDKWIYILGLFGPIMTIPQITKIWVDQNAAGVSVVSWSAYLVSAVIWLFYGIFHKEKPIVFIYSIWIVMEIAVVVGVLLYG